MGVFVSAMTQRAAAAAQAAVRPLSQPVRLRHARRIGGPVPIASRRGRAGCRHRGGTAVRHRQGRALAVHHGRAAGRGGPGRHDRPRRARAAAHAQPFIRYDRSVLGGQLADRYLRDHRIVPHQRLEMDSLLGVAALVEQRDLGVALLPDWSSLWSITLRARARARCRAARPCAAWAWCGKHVAARRRWPETLLEDARARIRARRARRAPAQHAAFLASRRPGRTPPMGVLPLSFGLRRKSKSPPWSACVTAGQEQLAVAAFVTFARGRGSPFRRCGAPVRRRRPAGASSRRLDAQADAVAAAHQGQRAADGGLGRDVQHDGARGRAAHAAVRDAHHVLHACARQLARDGHVAGLRACRARPPGRCA